MDLPVRRCGSGSESARNWFGIGADYSGALTGRTFRMIES